MGQDKLHERFCLAVYEKEQGVQKTVL